MDARGRANVQAVRSEKGSAYEIREVEREREEVESRVR